MSLRGMEVNMLAICPNGLLYERVKRKWKQPRASTTALETCPTIVGVLAAVLALTAVFPEVKIPA